MRPRTAATQAPTAAIAGWRSKPPSSARRSNQPPTVASSPAQYAGTASEPTRTDDALDVAGRLRGADRGLGIAIGLVPVGRAAVQVGHELRLVGLELVPQELADEWVVAEPAALGVERHEEGALVRERLEAAAVQARAVQDGAAEGNAQPVEH